MYYSEFAQVSLHMAHVNGHNIMYHGTKGHTVSLGRTVWSSDPKISICIFGEILVF